MPAGRPAAGCTTVADVALAAAQVASPRLRCGGACVLPGVPRPAMKWSSPTAPCRPCSRTIYDANRHLLRGLLERFGAAVCQRPPAFCATSPRRCRVRHRGCCRRPRSRHLVGWRIDRRGRSCARRRHRSRSAAWCSWRVAIKPGRPVAMGVLPGRRSGHAAAFAGLPGNPAAVYVTFVRVVWPLLLRLAGAAPRQPIALPVRATFAYRKRKGRREYVRVALRHAAGQRRSSRRSKFPVTAPASSRHDRDRWAGRTRRGCHRSGAGRDGGVPVLRGADGGGARMERSDIQGRLLGRTCGQRRPPHSGCAPCGPTSAPAAPPPPHPPAYSR